MTMSDRDRELIARFGLTEEQVERDAELAESGGDLGLTGRVYYGLHLDHGNEEMVSVSLRIPKDTLARLDANARRYHLSRSEYMRRRLVEA